MSLTQISTSRTGGKEFCPSCHSGRTTSFNWQYALEEGNGLDIPNDINLYTEPIALKTGNLFQCKTCKEHWYLDGDEAFMNHARASKIALIHEWSAAQITLTKEQTKAIKKIGKTPSLANGGTSYQLNETPCSIKTKTGEVFETAIVCIQTHAPFEYWRKHKLASDIEEITPSTYALPLKVRTATAHAVDIRMGYAPTTIELSNNSNVIVNWTQNFLKIEGVDTSKSVVHKYNPDNYITESLRNRFTPNYEFKEKITYFIADSIHQSYWDFLLYKN